GTAPGERGRRADCYVAWLSDCMPATGATRFGLPGVYVTHAPSCHLWREVAGRRGDFLARGQEAGPSVPNTPEDRAATGRGQNRELRRWTRGSRETRATIGRRYSGSSTRPTTAALSPSAAGSRDPVTRRNSPR